MSAWSIFWICLAIFLGILETSTVNLVAIWFALSALITAAVAATGVRGLAQIIVFVVLSAIFVAATRPLAKKLLNKKVTATNADRIIGSNGVVIQRIDPIQNVGQIKVMGQIWSAKAGDGIPIEENTIVVVTALEGVKVVVKAKDKQ